MGLLAGLRKRLGTKLGKNPVDDQVWDSQTPYQEPNKISVWFESVLESVPSGVLAIDASGRTVLANSEFQRQFRIHAIDLVGRKADEFVPLEFQDWWLHLSKGGSSMNTQHPRLKKDLVCRRPDGSSFPAETCFKFIETPHGGFLVGSIVDISERLKSEDEIRERESRLLQIADAMPHVVWVADNEGKIEYFNRRWYEYSGFDVDGDLQAWWEKVESTEAKDQRAQWSLSFARGEPFEMKLQIWNEGRRDFRWNLVKVVPIRTKADGVRWYGSFTDINEQIELERVLIESDRAKDQFLAMVSHELRSPLGIILGYVDILRESQSPDEREIALQAIRRSAKTQLQLVSDLLDISRIVEGKMSLSIGICDLHRIVQHAVDLVRFSAEAKKLNVKITGITAPLRLMADESRLQQVLWNLLSNAVKFTPEKGQITVEVEQPDESILIRVKDSGAGFDGESQKKLFHRFWQGGTQSGRVGGLGLGLSIVKQIVDLHKGRVWAESPGLGQGATFSVELPIGAGPA